MTRRSNRMPMPSALGHRAPLGWLLVPFAFGLILAKLAPGPLPTNALLALALASLGVGTGYLRARPRHWSVAFTFGLTALGAAYYELRRDRLAEWRGLPAREVEVGVSVRRIFPLPSRPDAFMGLGRITTTAPHLQDLVGQRVAFSLRLPPERSAPIRGEHLHVRAVLEPLPRRPPPDPFEAYLVNAGINFRLTRGQVVSQARPASAYARWRETLRTRASQALARGLDAHPELVAPLRGMLLGERAGLSAEQEALFLRSGAMHLFAISGLHVGVIAGGIIGLLRLLRLPRIAVLLLGSAALWGYVDVTGALPSAVRAWLMVVCALVAHSLRAPGNLLAALTGSALLVLLLDPMQLFGAGFQMSYAIVAALLFYGLPLGERWGAAAERWRDLPRASQTRWQRGLAAAGRQLAGAAAISIAASLVGTLSSVAFFGYFTPGSVVANLLLIPLASLAIWAGLLALVGNALALGPLVVLFNHAAALVLALMHRLLEAWSGVPGTGLPAEFRWNWLGGILLVALVAHLAWGYAGNWSARRGGWWAPVAGVAVALGAGMRLTEG